VVEYLPSKCKALSSNSSTAKKKKKKKGQVIKNYKRSQATVVHTCNPSYLGGCDQEDHSLRPAGANSS
jgi:hypothetical protein